MNNEPKFEADYKQINRNVACFGDAFPFGREQIIESAKKSIMFRVEETHNSQAMSILSDAQELMERGDVERARQLINVAKVLICENHDIFERKGTQQ